MHLEDRSEHECLSRFISKFVEAGMEKVDRLLDLYMEYSDRSGGSTYFWLSVTRFSLNVENERADVGRLARPNSQARTRTGKTKRFRCLADNGQDWQLVAG